MRALVCVLLQDAGEDKQNRKSVFSAIFREFHWRFVFTVPVSAPLSVVHRVLLFDVLALGFICLIFFSLVQHLSSRRGVYFTMVTFPNMLCYPLPIRARHTLLTVMGLKYVWVIEGAMLCMAPVYCYLSYYNAFSRHYSIINTTQPITYHSSVTYHCFYD